MKRIMGATLVPRYLNLHIRAILGNDVSGISIRVIPVQMLPRWGHERFVGALHNVCMTHLDTGAVTPSCRHGQYVLFGLSCVR